jgi:hypothetical protein
MKSGAALALASTAAAISVHGADNVGIPRGQLCEHRTTRVVLKAQPKRLTSF